MIVGLQIEYLVNGAHDEAVWTKLRAALERAGDEHADFRRHLWPRLIDAFEAEERRQFDAEGAGPNRGSWAELSPGYAAWKAEHFPGKPLLRRTDSMYDALTNSNSQFALREQAEESLVFGTRGLEYPSFHQLGTTRMVDRPPYDLSEDFQADMQRALVEASRDAIKASRLSDFVEAP